MTIIRNKSNAMLRLRKEDRMEYRFSLKTARVYANLTLQEAAKKLGVNYSTLCNWENGRTEPKASTLMSMAQLYGVRYEDIFLPSKAT